MSKRYATGLSGVIGGMEKIDTIETLLAGQAEHWLFAFYLSQTAPFSLAFCGLGVLDNPDSSSE